MLWHFCYSVDVSYAPGPDLNRGRAVNPIHTHTSLRRIIEQRFGRGTDDAWDYLASVLNGTAESVQEKVLSDGRIIEVRQRPTITERAAAAELIIAYAHGRPTQNAVIRAEQGPAALEDADLAERVKGILDKARTLDAAYVELKPASGTEPPHIEAGIKAAGDLDKG